ncbi:MAG: hypothetical protein AAGM46_26400 [Cyanobacteria bacterium J06582_2]
MKSTHAALETSSYVCWNLGLVSTISQQAKTALEAIPSSASQEILDAVGTANAKLDQLCGFVDVMAKVQASSIHLQNTLNNQVYKMRRSYLDFLVKWVPEEDVTELMFGPMSFYRLFREDVV